MFSTKTIMQQSTKSQRYFEFVSVGPKLSEVSYEHWLQLHTEVDRGACNMMLTEPYGQYRRDVERCECAVRAARLTSAKQSTSYSVGRGRRRTYSHVSAAETLSQLSQCKLPVKCRSFDWFLLNVPPHQSQPRAAACICLVSVAQPAVTDSLRVSSAGARHQIPRLQTWV